MPGFTQDTIPQTFVVTASFKDTITMTSFSPSMPTDTGKVVLYIWTDRILGDTLENAVFNIIPITKGKNWRTEGGRLVLPGTASKKTDSTGYAEIEVYQSGFVHPSKYKGGAWVSEPDSLKYNISVAFEGLEPFEIYNYVAPSDSNAWIGGP